MTENGCHMHMLWQPFLNMGIISLQAAAAFTDCAAEIQAGFLHKREGSHDIFKLRAENGGSLSGHAPCICSKEKRTGQNFMIS